MSELTRTPVLYELYAQFQADEDLAAFIHRVKQRYSIATLERLVSHGSRLVRRAGALSLGHLGTYEVNASLGRALNDPDRGVRLLAENGIRQVWTRAGNSQQNAEVSEMVSLNIAKRFSEAHALATRFLKKCTWYAEAWNQRAISNYCLNRYEQSIQDCQQALELNPYHFAAAAGMGQGYLKLGGQALALEAFRRALKLNPNLEGVRANVVYLSRNLNES